MSEIALDQTRVEWRKPLIVVVAFLAAIFVLILYSPNFGALAGLLIVAPFGAITLLALVIGERGRNWSARVAILCLFVILSWQMVKRSASIRSEVRWLTVSTYWKARVLEQSPQNASGLKFISWDGWGMFAQDTEVYLVFDPSDDLRHYSPTNLSGLPCPVSHVQRLQRQWYSVTFYTSQGWQDNCGFPSARVVFRGQRHE